MKMFSIVSLFSLLIGFSTNISIYSYGVPKLDGGNQSLEDFRHKKIMVITLPCQRNASSDSMLYVLDTLSIARSQTLKIIAVPSIEDGFTPETKAELTSWYRSKLNSNIIIADGLYTRKSSETAQHPLFKWLTMFALNESFDLDVEGPEFKFLVSEEGELFGVLKKINRLHGSAVQKALNN